MKKTYRNRMIRLMTAQAMAKEAGNVTTPETPTPPPTPDPQTLQIQLLAAQGKTPLQISIALNLPLATVLKALGL